MKPLPPYCGQGFELKASKETPTTDNFRKDTSSLSKFSCLYQKLSSQYKFSVYSIDAMLLSKTNQNE